MLSNLIITKHKFILIKDELGQEKISLKFISQLLKEQGEDVSLKTLPLKDELSDGETLQKFLKECGVRPQENGKQWNVVLPNFSDFLTYQKPSVIFQFLNNLKKCEYVKCTFLWISLQHLHHNHAQYLVAACEYMADVVLHLQTTKELSILICKPGGGVSYNNYTYTRTKSEFKVELRKGKDKFTAVNMDSAEVQQTEQLATFKIELDEEEIVARNAMKMPYEKALEATESNVIYIPDAADDFDDEDPDEDLNI